MTGRTAVELSQQQAARSKGVAMLLVLFAIVIAVTLAVSYLNGVSTVSGITRNVEAHRSARAVAESAMMLAIERIRNDADWRSKVSHGVWVENQSLAGGTFTLRGEDADGDLSDDPADPVTLTVVGRFGGTSHTIQAVVTPSAVVQTSMSVLMIVGDTDLKSSDRDKQSFFESLGYSVTVMSQGTSEADMLAAAEAATVVFISESVASTNVNTKLTSSPRGIVSEETYLQDDLGFTSSNGGNDTRSHIEIQSVDHPILLGVEVGRVQFATANQATAYTASNTVSAGTVVLARHDSNGRPAMMAMDVGAQTHSGSGAAGRRVSLAWGGGEVYVDEFTEVGQRLLRQSLEWAAEEICPGAPIAHWQFDEGSGTEAADSAGGSLHGTLDDGPTWQSADGAIGGALRFDGSNDHVRVPNSAALNLTSTISFSVWIHSDGWGGTQRILQKGNDSQQYSLYTQGGTFYFRLGNRGTLSHTAPPANAWTHVAATYDGARMCLYYDGELVAQQNTSGSLGTSNFELFIGAKRQGNSSTNNFDGMLDDLRIYDYGLVAAEVAFLASGGSTEEDALPEPQLLALYEFNETHRDPVLLHHWKLDESSSLPDMPMLALSQSLSIGGSNAKIDTYSSLSGEYGENGNVSTNAVVTINSTLYSTLTMWTNALLGGDVHVGPNAVLDLFSILLWSGSEITGTEDTLLASVSPPSLSSPTGGAFASSSGTVNLYGNQTLTVNSDRRYNSISLSGVSRVRVQGHVTMVVDGDVNVNQNNAFEILDESSLTLYVGGAMNIGGAVNANSKDPSKLRVNMVGNNRNFAMWGRAEVHALVQNPNGDLTVWNSTQFHGGFVGRSLSGDGGIHLDLGTTANGVGGPIAIDSAGSTDGTYRSGVAKGQAGQIDQAARFDGTDDFVLIPHANSMMLAEGTVAFWFHSESLSGTRALFSKDALNLGEGGHLHITTDGNRLEARLQSRNQSYEVQSSSNLQTNRWYHVAFTFGPGGMKLYLDGQLVDDDDYDGGIGQNTGGDGNTEPIVLGAGTNQSGTGVAEPRQDYFKGYLDDVRIYDAALADSQVANLFAGNAPGNPDGPGAIVADTSDYGEPLDMLIEDVDEVEWLSGGGLHVQDDTRIISTLPATKLHNAITATGRFTIEVKFQVKDDNEDGPARIVSYSNSSSRRNVAIAQDEDEYVLHLRTSETGLSGTPDVESSDLFDSASDVHHMLVSYSGSHLTVYRNGQQIQEVPRSGDLNDWDNTMKLVFANEAEEDRPWRGKLLRVAIYDQSINQFQAANLFAGQPPGDGTPTADNTAFSVRWLEGMD